MPSDLDRVLAVVAATFHFSPRDLWAMDLEELLFWREQAEWINGSRK